MSCKPFSLLLTPSPYNGDGTEKSHQHQDCHSLLKCLNQGQVAGIYSRVGTRPAGLKPELTSLGPGPMDRAIASSDVRDHIIRMYWMDGQSHTQNNGNASTHGDYIYCMQ